MRGIDDQDIHAGVHQRGDPFFGIPGRPHGSTDPQRPQFIFRSQGIIGGLLEVLGRDHPAQAKVVVHHQDLFDAMMVQQRQYLVVVRILLDRNQTILGCHHLGYRGVELGFEAQVPVRHDADEVFAFHDRNAGNAVRLGQLDDGLDGGVGSHGDRVADDAALVFLDPEHVPGLFLGRHVLVDDADAAYLRQANGQASLGDRVHGGGNDRNVEGKLAREARFQADFPRQDFGVGRLEHHVVERESLVKYPHGQTHRRLNAKLYGCA